MDDGGRARIDRAGLVRQMALAVMAALVVVGCGSDAPASSASVSSQPGNTAQTATTVPDSEPLIVTINVENDTLVNPIPPRFGIELGGNPDITALLSEGTNQVELPAGFLSETMTEGNRIAVTFWDDLKEPGGLAGTVAVVVYPAAEPTLEVTVTEDGISTGGPWLQAFEVNRGNPIREAECDAVSGLIEQSLTTLEWSNLVESELDSDSSVADFREAYAKHHDLESAYLDTVLAFEPVYFSRFTELEDILRKRVELTALASEASSGRLNGYIDELNATIDDLNRVEDDLVNAWNVACL